ncbi:hypothetical protein, partial [Pseudoduganella sp. RAF53_2]|uniref:hypothetical protein n=1 Tax=Pseudoduganella sp. RAF53_2 TaxID=3233060 RepID=UPI003F9AF2BF
IHDRVGIVGDDDKAVVGMKINATKQHDVLLDKVRIRTVTLSVGSAEGGRLDDYQFSMQPTLISAPGCFP